MNWNRILLGLSLVVLLRSGRSCNSKSPARSYIFTGETTTPKDNQTSGNTTEILEKLVSGVIQFAEEIFSSSFECPMGSGLFRDQFDCATYYECKRGKFTEHKCENGLGFSEFLGECVPRENAGCPLGPLDEQYVCHGSGLEPHPSDCTKYFVCVREKAFLGTCSHGKLFDGDVKVCMPENSAKCESKTATQEISHKNVTNSSSGGNTTSNLKGNVTKSS